MAGPKKAAVLAYLGFQCRPARLVSRDKLLGLFWPERSQVRAQAALRKTLHDLRRVLGGSVLVCQGRRQIGLNPEDVWCDARAMEDACESDEYASALDLYQGPFLDGFHVEGSPEFSQWVDGTRDTLRRRAASAAWKLAHLHRTHGDKHRAAEYARCAHRLGTPGDEEVTQRVMVFLDEIGDRSAAVLAYEELARNLRDRLDLEPSPETRQLVEQIRAR